MILLRIEIQLLPKENGMLSLPRVNLYMVQAMVYGLLEREFAAQLHDVGFELGKRRFKLFGFGWLKGEGRPQISKDQITFKPPIRLTITSPVEGILSQLAGGALEREILRLGNNLLECRGVRVEDPHVEGDEAVLQAISPVSCYSTLRRPDGRPYTAYHDPREKTFQDQIHDNLVKKFQVLHPDRVIPEGRVSFRPIGNPRLQVARFRPDDSMPIKGWWGRFRLQGPGELLRIGLDAGLGAKNSAGWGCMELIGERKGRGV